MGSKKACSNCEQRVIRDAMSDVRGGRACEQRVKALLTLAGRAQSHKRPVARQERQPFLIEQNFHQTSDLLGRTSETPTRKARTPGSIRLFRNSNEKGKNSWFNSPRRSAELLNLNTTRLSATRRLTLQRPALLRLPSRVSEGELGLEGQPFGSVVGRVERAKTRPKEAQREET